MKHLFLYGLMLFVSGNLCYGQNQSKSYYPAEPETKEVVTSHGPLSITRNIKQDKKGNIWIAAFDGVFRYDPSALLRIGGKAFTNITSEVSKARFFDVLEDRKGNFWFSTIGSGVFYYDPSAALRAGDKSFRNFTTKDGLANDVVLHIYEDKSGNIWFGTERGASRWDGKSFQNFTPNEGLPNSNDDDNNENSIIEDETGRFWFGTRGKVFNFDGKKFTVVKHNGESFTNIRTITKDKKCNIWLAGEVGLWRYDGSTFTNFNENFTGYVYEDREGNIWTSSQPDYTGNDRWALSRYERNSLSGQKPSVTNILADYEVYNGMIFGILEAQDGSIWFGALDGVRRFDGKSITYFKKKE